MTKITSRKTRFLFARPTGQGNKRAVTLNDTFVEHLAMLGAGVFRYRAPHAPRPTQPRKRFAV
jgi:hypothetical protein